MEGGVEFKIFCPLTAAAHSPSRTRTIRFLTPEELRNFLEVIRDSGTGRSSSSGTGTGCAPARVWNAVRQIERNGAWAPDARGRKLALNRQRVMTPRRTP
jgi:hypothetical protein